MINDTITYPKNQIDDFCNMLIITSNELSKDLGITYGEFWIYILYLVFAIIFFYFLLSTFALYTKYKKILKVLYWISIIANLIIFWSILSFISIL